MTVNVLLVDDEPDSIELFRQKFRRELRQGDYAVRFAQSGAEALEALSADGTLHPVVVLSDINMPGMSGLELLAEVRQRWPELSVIMITAYGDAENRRQALERGASDFVSKPVDFAELKDALKAHAAGGDQ